MLLIESVHTLCIPMKGRVMAINFSYHKKIVKLLGLMLILYGVSVDASLSNLTPNDPFPYFSTAYPYTYLSRRERIVFEKIGTECFEDERFQFSISPFFQWADQGIDFFYNTAPIGDLPTRLNVLALFYDNFLRQRLVTILNLNTTSNCLDQIFLPQNSDPRKEFGHFSLPLEYHKGGARFELILKIWESCFKAFGFKAQFGVAEIRQSIRAFDDLSCRALGLGCPVSTASNNLQPSSASTTCPTCPTCTVIPTIPGRPNEIRLLTPASTIGCCDSKCCIFPFNNCDCKRVFIPGVMNQFYKIADYLDYDITNYYETRPEDLRLMLWYRDVIEINSIDPFWPRALFMPFFEVGAAIPLTHHINPRALFAVPFGNNGHSSAGLMGGFDLDFIDILEIAVAAGITKFFDQEICCMPLPTNELESQLYPYKADVCVNPGYTTHVSFSLNAWNLISRLSVWFQFMFLSHSEDKIKICRSLIPEESDYYPLNVTNPERISPSFNVSGSLARETLNQGFLVRKAEELSKWESHLFNIGFNYDISPHIALGLLYQHSFSYSNITQRRNAYCTDTLTFSAIAYY